MPVWLKKWFSTDYLKIKSKIVKWIYLAISMDNKSIKLGLSLDSADDDDAYQFDSDSDDDEDWERRKAKKMRARWPKPWSLPQLCPQVLGSHEVAMTATDSNGKCPLAWLVKCLLKEVRQMGDYEATLPSAPSRNRNGRLRLIHSGGSEDDDDVKSPTPDGNDTSTELAVEEEVRQLRQQQKRDSNTINQLRSRRDELLSVVNGGDDSKSEDKSKKAKDSQGKGKKAKGQKAKGKAKGKKGKQGKGGGDYKRRCMICLSTDHQAFAANTMVCPEGLKAGLTERPACYSINLQQALDGRKGGWGFVVVCGWCGKKDHRLFAADGTSTCEHSAFQNAFPNGRPLAGGATGHMRALEAGSDEDAKQEEEDADSEGAWDGDDFEAMQVLQSVASVEQGFATCQLGAFEPAAWAVTEPTVSSVRSRGRGGVAGSVTVGDEQLICGIAPAAEGNCQKFEITEDEIERHRKQGTLRVIQMAGRFPGLIAGGSKPLETRKNLDGWSPRHDGTFVDLPDELRSDCLYLFAKGRRLIGTAALFGRWYPLWAGSY